jgi:hypothetical protein
VMPMRPAAGRGAAIVPGRGVVSIDRIKGG